MTGTIAFGVSGGNIVGAYGDSSAIRHGFLYNGTTYTTLDATVGKRMEPRPLAIPAATLSGYYDDSSNVRHGFLYNGSTWTALDDPLGTTGTVAYGISGGNIVGAYSDDSGTYHGFIYNGTTYTTLDDPSGEPPNGSTASGISWR